MEFIQNLLDGIAVLGVSGAGILALFSGLLGFLVLGLIESIN